MPMERAVPAMIFSAASIVVAFRSGILVCAMSRTWALVMLPTLVLCGSALPLSTPAAFLISSGAGGVLVMKVKLRSSKMEISTGMMLPRWPSVAALYCLTKSMMFTPCGPSAGPTGPAGGPGGRCPPGSGPLRGAASLFLLGGMGLIPHLDLGYLVERQLDGRLPAEDRHQHLELLGVRGDLVYRGGQGGERGGPPGNRRADLEVRGGRAGRLGLLRSDLGLGRQQR